jgi:Domain of unknown function (DUF6249)
VKTNPTPVFVRQLQLGALAALITLASIALLRADATPPKNPPAPPSTNSTNATNASPVSATTRGLSITIDDDDDDSSSDAKDPKHPKGGELNGHEILGATLEAVLIPIVAILATFGTPVLIVFFICYFKYRRRQENLALVREFLNKGLPVPPELLDPARSWGVHSVGKDSLGRSKSDLRRGFSLTFVGLGITLAFYVNDPHSTMWGWGLIPLVMGIGYLISGWFENRQRKSGEDSRTPPPGNPP